MVTSRVYAAGVELKHCGVFRGALAQLGTWSAAYALRLEPEQLSARIQQIEAKEKFKQREQDTRRKILLGSLLQLWMEEDESIRGTVEQNLPTFLVRKIDRELFGLPPLPAIKADD